MKNYLLGFVLLLAISIAVTGQYEYYAHHPAADSQSGSTATIAVPNSPEATGNAEQTERNHPGWHLAFKVFGWPSGVTVWALFLTLAVITDQTRHVARAAKGTEDAVTASKESSQRELRAYLVVSLNSGTIQDRTKNLKFDGIPSLSNVGKTPAHNVRYRNNSAILTAEQAKTHSFPPGDEEISGYDLGIGQLFTMTVVCRDFVPEQDVEGIRDGSVAHLYTWGSVCYDDAFGNPHITEWCHRLWFAADPDKVGNWKVGGNYIPGRNKAT